MKMFGGSAIMFPRAPLWLSKGLMSRIGPASSAGFGCQESLRALEMLCKLMTGLSTNCSIACSGITKRGANVFFSLMLACWIIFLQRLY